MYYTSFIAVHPLIIESVLNTAVSSLTKEEQLQLVSSMHRYLHNQGYTSSDASRCLGI
ncbi:hypothetical protein V1520DRAFT_335710 [Lipomyces starkeyi]